MIERIREEDIVKRMKSGELQLLRTYRLPQTHPESIRDLQIRDLTPDDIGSLVLVHEPGATLTAGYLIDTTKEKIYLDAKMPQRCGRRPSLLQRLNPFFGITATNIYKEEIISYSLLHNYSELERRRPDLGNLEQEPPAPSGLSSSHREE